MNFPIPVLALEAYLPHRESAVWIDAVRSADEGRGLCEVTAAANDARWFRNGELRHAVYLEWMAQAYGYAQAAAMLGKGIAPKTARAMLVGVNDFEVIATARAGSLLLIHVERTHQMGPISVVAARVETSAGALLAKGRIKLYSDAV